jgi:hypothetical protein
VETNTQGRAWVNGTHEDEGGRGADGNANVLSLRQYVGNFAIFMHDELDGSTVQLWRQPFRTGASHPRQVREGGIAYKYGVRSSMEDTPLHTVDMYPYFVLFVQSNKEYAVLPR